MNGEPLLSWPQPLHELLGFVAAFLVTGAVGFRFAALGGLLGPGASAEEDFARAAARRVALFGVLGAVIGGARFLSNLPAAAARQKLEVGALLATQFPVQLQAALLAAALAGFVLAATGRGAGWPLAGLAVVLLPLRGAMLGQMPRVVNPVHEYAAGFWIGTLFLLTAFGLSPTFRGALSPERHAALAKRMVNGFSRLALGSVAVLVVFGVITAVRHLKRIENLWSTPYGITYMVKLAIVAGVLGLGAWNWRRQKARLGTAEGTAALRRTALAELSLAGVVLLVTAVLVSLPSPE